MTATPCPTCQNGRIRETTGMVCQTCGRDYGAPAVTPAIERAAESLGTATPGDQAEQNARAALAAALDVEEMARAIHADDQGPDVWNMESDYYQDVYRANARAVRTAILGGAA